MGEHEGAPVVPVVVEVEVGDRRLGRGGLDRRIRIDDSGRGVETGIGDAPDAHPPVVAGHLAQEPLDRVVGVGALIDPGGVVAIGAGGGGFDEGALGQTAAADILEDKDVTGAQKAVPGGDILPVFVRAVRSDGVGGSGEEERISPAGVLRHIEGGEEPDAVPHGDLIFVFRVMRLDFVRRRGRDRLGLRGREQAEDAGERERSAQHTPSQGFHAASCITNRLPL